MEYTGVQQSKIVMYREPQSLTAQEEIIVTFSDNCYPFLSISQPLPTFFKTAQLYTLNRSDLERLTSIHHRNLVNLKRIVRTTVRGNISQANSKELIFGYSLYYEALQRGIHNRKKLSDGLNRLATFMVQNQIYYRIRQRDIGYDQFGQIKVFVPPSSLLRKTGIEDRNASSVQKLTGKDVFESVNQLINSSMSDTKIKMDRINQIDRQLQQLRQLLLEQKRKKKQKQKKTTNNQIFENQTQKQGGGQSGQQGYREEPLKKKQTKSPFYYEKPVVGKSRFAQNTGKILEGNRQSLPHQLLRQSGLNEMNLHLPMEVKNWKNLRVLNTGGQDHQTAQKYQQNFNCINIYHSTEPQEVLKRPIISIEQKPNHYAIHHFPTTKKISAIYEYDENCSDSLDTYELEIGQSREMPRIVPRAKLRHTVLPTSSVDQRNYSNGASHRDRNRNAGRGFNIIYGSVGRKQCSDILKYTALSGQRSESIKKKPNRKSNIHEQSVESESGEINERDDKNIRAQQRYQMENLEPQKRMKSSQVFKLVQIQDDRIQNKVTEAVLKTRAAIELLKKVRNNPKSMKN